MKYCFHCVGKIEDDTARYCLHCGKQCSVHYSNSNELPPNTYLNNGRYFVGKSIGSGGFGITYIGFDTKLDKKIVIKEAFYSGLSNRNTINKENKFPLEVKYDFSSEHETREFVNKVTKKVREECSNLSKAEGLDNIVKVYDWFQENNTAYIILEHIPGETMVSKISREGRYKWDELHTLINPLMQSLSQLHKKDILHLDIKPGNIMIKENYNGVQFVLIDFGVAKSQYSNHATRSISYSECYSPPEQRTLREENGKYTDVYALAATIYTALTGKSPSAALCSTVEENFPELENLRNYEDVPDYVADTLEYALQPDYEKRCQTVDEFIERLDFPLLAQEKFKNKKINYNNINPTYPNNPSFYTNETISVREMGNSQRGRVDSGTVYANNSQRGRVDSKTAAANDTNDNSNTGQVKIYEKKPSFLRTAFSVLVIAGIVGGIAMFGIQKGLVTIPSTLAKESESSNTDSAVSDIEPPRNYEDSEDIISQLEYVTVPDVNGLSRQSAETMMKSVGLKYEFIEEENESSKDGLVMRQSPVGGDKVESGKTVRLVVAKNKEKSSENASTSSDNSSKAESSKVEEKKQESNEVDIPDVRNLTYEEAVKKLSANDLSAEIKEYQYSDTAAENSVISQTPLNGKIIKNSRVLLVISKGSDKSLVKIGSYIGQDIGSVQADLESQGIRVLYRYIDSSAVQGNILSQSVAAGSTVSQGDTISFNVAQKEMYFDTNNFFGNAMCSSEMSGFEKGNVVQFDGNAWAPNSSSGVGEYLYFDSPIYVKEVTMNGCILDIGCSRSNEDFYNYGRPTKLRFEFSDGYSETVNVSDVMTHQIVYFKKTVTTTSLKVIIESSVGGKIMDNPCISGIATVG